MEDTFDAIIIGSGIGGMTVASLLSQVQGMRVLLLEKHFLVGGFTNEFQRKQTYSWEVGLHYVGGMKSGSGTRAIMDLVTSGKVAWNELPYEFERFVFPDMSVNVPRDPEEYKEYLLKMFPDEQEGIGRYFEDGEKVYNSYLEYCTENATGLHKHKIQERGLPYASTTTKEYLDEHFDDERLKSILTAHWGDYGLPPSRSSFLAHAFITGGFWYGGFFPEGGSQKISQAVRQVIADSGGTVLFGTEVTEVLIEDGRTIGVRTRNTVGKETEYYSDCVVSNVGAERTYVDLVPSDYCKKERQDVSSFERGLSAVILFMGLSDSPERCGATGSNYWVYDSYGYESVAQITKDLLAGKAREAFISFPTLKHSGYTGHTAQAIVMVDPSEFEMWKDRPEAYYQAKDKMTAGLIDLMERSFPGISDLIEYKELGTPLTILHYLHRVRGEMYGLPLSPQRFELGWLRPQTSIKGLYLSGTDVCAPGIYGGMLGGVMAASEIMGRNGYKKILEYAKKRTET
jgi:phytoene dehydrogenase-like protein